MCAINGLVSKISTPSIELGVVELRDILQHRGPDDAGIWVSPDMRVALGHRRLAVIDITPLGHQPMLSVDGRYVIVFNGEIYNYLEIKQELLQLGFYFRTSSDTEVILVAYHVWGEDCIKRFNGMFSFVIYDKGDGVCSPTLFFARDRTGKKPFYYFYDGVNFEFASELKGISHKRDVSLEALNYYLALGYIPSERCFFEGVKKLMPAHAGKLDLDTFDLQVWRYWDLPVNLANPKVGGDELADQAQALLSDAVKIRMASDVPLGVLLSGGLDSSIIAAIASKLSSKPIKTFTLSLPGSKLDEANYAQCVSDYLGTDHHVLSINKPCIKDLEEIAKFIDEPIADSSLIPSYLISKLTREHVTVVLGGDGGDELFGGYTDYQIALDIQRRLKYVPKIILKLVSYLAALLPAGVKGRNFLASLRDGALKRHIWGSPYFDIELRKRLFNSDQLKILGVNLEDPEKMLLEAFNRGSDPVDSMTRSHFSSILPDDFLVKVDRSSMAVGLEARTPFLDYRLVEFAFSKIPSNWKVFGGETRRVERIIGKRLLPPQLDTKRKQGFSIPIDEWMRDDQCRMLRDHIKYLPEYINRDEVENLIDGLFSGRSNGARLYALLILGIAMKNKR